MFYDDDWKDLVNKYPLVAKKIEELRCETVNYEQYDLEFKQLKHDVKDLAQSVKNLLDILVEHPEQLKSLIKVPST